MLQFISHYSDPSAWVLTGVVFFLGLTLGWFCKFNIYVTIIGVLLFIPVLNFLVTADHLFFNLPFIAGFLVHTHKKIMTTITRRT